MHDAAHLRCLISSLDKTERTSGEMHGVSRIGSHVGVDAFKQAYQNQRERERPKLRVLLVFGGSFVNSLGRQVAEATRLVAREGLTWEAPVGALMWEEEGPRSFALERTFGHTVGHVGGSVVPKKDCIFKGSLVCKTSVLRTFNSCSTTTHHTSLIIHHSSYTTHHTPLIIHHSSYTTHHTPLITHHSSYTTHHTPLIIHHSSYTTHHTPLIIHHSSYTTHHTLLIIHHSSYTTHHTPLIIHHSSHTTHHTPLIHHSSYTTHHTPLIIHY